MLYERYRVQNSVQVKISIFFCEYLVSFDHVRWIQAAAH